MPFPRVLALLALFPLACTSTREGDDPLPASEQNAWARRAGWRPLFDGRSTAGWVGYGTQRFPSGWSVRDGCLVHEAGGGDLVYAAQTFADFELEFEWLVPPGGNSGVKYRVPASSASPHLFGPEYQVLDDTAHADGLVPKRRAASLYDVIAPATNAPAAAGVFHQGRIVARGDRIEHWLDGVRVVDVERTSPDWEAAWRSSKFAETPDFAAARRGWIGLQDHGDAVRYRRLRVRDLERLPGRPVELFDGATLDGWTALGDAIYEVDQGSILGRIGGGGQSFLITDDTYADFLFEVELKAELPGNSGIQVRSHVNEEGRLYGYQIEIDSSERAWSGGLYDEGRRGWLDDLADDDYARTAFRPGEWNTYRIECVGPTIKAWVNGIPTADFVDDLDREGVIGLQVHSGDDTRVRWRNFRLQDLGRSVAVQHDAAHADD